MGKLVTVVDYGMGNLRSVAKALEMVGADVCVSSRADDLERADRIVLPGVGAFADGMANLEAAGLVEALRRQVLEIGKPFLGICLGMQMLARQSQEGGLHQGLGWVDADVVPFDVAASGLKVPHMGWNEVVFGMESPLFRRLGRAPVFYFVHSYHMVCRGDAPIAAMTDYGGAFTSAILQGNILATQFHPEKSQDKGLQLLENFLAWEV